MPYTDQQLRDFADAYAKRRHRQLLVLIPFVGLILLYVLAAGCFGDSGLPLSRRAMPMIMIVAVLGLMGFSLYNWRCPACHGYFGRTHNPRHCPKCGVQLRD